MPWLEDMVSAWGAEEAVTRPPLNQYLHMTELQAEMWLASKPKFVAGADEVGYGALAGPLVVCGVCATYGWSMPGLRDSKKLSFSQLEDRVCDLYALQRAGTIRVHLATATAQRIDELGARTALRKAHMAALEESSVGVREVMLVCDGVLDLPGPYCVSIPKADTFIPQVMAASIIAKYTRDCYMKDMAEEFPQYGFDRHVGYGTSEHYASLRKHGPCALHRKSYNLHGAVDEARDREDCGVVSEVAREPA